MNTITLALPMQYYILWQLVTIATLSSLYMYGSAVYVYI